jgi:hypothetical protein
MNIYSKGSKSVTQQINRDVLVCVVSGLTQISLVSPWETGLMGSGKSFPDGGYLPKQFSPADLFDETLKDVTVHQVTLNPGDCIYIPSYWWY